MESIALVSNALGLLEIGKFAICKFGTEVEVLHDFASQFTEQSGAELFSRLTFTHGKTDVTKVGLRYFFIESFVRSSLPTF